MQNTNAVEIVLPLQLRAASRCVNPSLCTIKVVPTSALASVQMSCIQAAGEWRCMKTVAEPLTLECPYPSSSGLGAPVSVRGTHDRDALLARAQL